MAQLPLLHLPVTTSQPGRNIIALAAGFAIIGFFAATATTSLYVSATTGIEQVAHRPVAVNRMRQLVPTSGTHVVARSRAGLDSAEIELPQYGPAQAPLPWSTLGMVAAGLVALVIGTKKVISMYPLSGLAGSMEPFLDAIEDSGVHQTAREITEDMLKAEAAGNTDWVLSCKTGLAEAMMMVSWEAVRKAARVQIACGTITVTSFVDTILVHAVPPLPTVDGLVSTSVLDVCENKLWRQEELRAIIPLLQDLYDCEQKFNVDLASILTGLMCRYTGCVSYTVLEARPEVWTEIEHQILVFLAMRCYGATVPYYG